MGQDCGGGPELHSASDTEDGEGREAGGAGRVGGGARRKGMFGGGGVGVQALGRGWARVTG